MDIVRARGQDPETCRELFTLAAEILGVAAVSVGVSRLKPAAPTVERATVRTDTVKRDPMLRQMRGSRQIPAETEATVVRIHMQYQGPSSEAGKRSDEPESRCRYCARMTHRHKAGRHKTKEHV
jgi:hypothetical protein